MRLIANLKDVALYDDEVAITATATILDIATTDSLPLSTSEFSDPVARNTKEGKHYIFNTTLSGIPLHWKNGKSDYEIAQSVIDENGDYELAIINGFYVWDALDQLNFFVGNLST